METIAQVAHAPRLELRHATKSFGRVRALVDGELTLWPGEVHALLGENGAGKSTLVKILAGVHRPDTGQLMVDGIDRSFATPAEARDAGIAVIYQEPTLFSTCRLPKTSTWAASRWGASGASITR